MRRARTLNLTDHGPNDINATISDATRAAINAGCRAGTVMARKSGIYGNSGKRHQ
jgi:hypothetical protein